MTPHVPRCPNGHALPSWDGDCSKCEVSAPLVPGRKDDAGKARWDLMPMRAVERIADVLRFGAEKYGPDSWQRLEDARGRYFAAALRHLTAWREGETLDAESGLPHLAHAGCCLVFLIALEAREASHG